MSFTYRINPWKPSQPVYFSNQTLCKDWEEEEGARGRGRERRKKEEELGRERERVGLIKGFLGDVGTD